MNSKYIILGYQIPETDLMGRVLYRVETTGGAFSWGDNPDVIDREEIKILEIVVNETHIDFGHVIGTITMVEPNSIVELPNNESAKLWMELK
jgi:hypothetical protein